MMRRLKTRRGLRYARRSREIPSITRPDFSANTKIILFAQTRRNSRVRRSPPFINSLPRARRAKGLLSRARSKFSRELSLLPPLSRKESAHSQQTEKQRQASRQRDEIRAGPLICREKPRIRRKIRFSAGQRPISE